MVIEARAEAAARDRDDAMSAAWHVAALMRSKKLPRHDEMISTRRRGSKREMSPEQQWAIMSALSNKVH